MGYLGGWLGGGGGVDAADTLSANAPFFKRAGTVVTASAVTPGLPSGSVSPDWPAHDVGDLALLIVESNWGGGVHTSINLTSAEGFVAIPGAPVQQGSGSGTTGSTNGSQLAVYWCRATSTSMSPPSVAGEDHVIAQILTFGDVKTTGVPYNAVATDNTETGTGSTTFTIPGLTTTVDRCLLAAFHSVATDGAFTNRADGWVNADLVDVHECTDHGTAAGAGGGFVGAVGIAETAGVFGATTASSVSGGSAITSVGAALSLALEPRSVAIGETTDDTAPIIANLDPAAGASIRSTTVIAFDVTDETSLMLVAILASFPDGSCEVVHDGDTFRGNYVGTANVRSEISNGYHFTVLRDTGWLQSPTFEYLVLDGGNIGVLE